MKTPYFTTCCLALTLLTSCAGNPQQEDPLKNTRKLVKEGHADLYNNGAFTVPNTQISLIPAAPSATEFGLELMGFRARQSFEQSLQNAKDSVYLVADGTKKSFQIAGDIHEGTDDVATAITDFSRPNSKLLIYKSYPTTKHIIGTSFELAGNAASGLYDAGEKIAQDSLKAGDKISEVASNGSAKTIAGSWQAAGKISEKSNQAALASLTYAGKSFVEGYAAIPEKLSQRGQAIAEAATWEEFSDGFSESNQWRGEQSQQMTGIMVEVTDNYTNEVGDSFSKAGDEFDNISETGVALATLKAARWVLQGLFWDGLIKPVGKMGAASVGYLAVNTVAFPVLVVGHGTYNSAEIAVQATWNVAASTYDFVAPTVIAATAALFSGVELVGGNLVAGATATAGTAAGSLSYLAGQTAAVTVKAAGYTTGKTVQYIGVPLVTAGIAVSGTAAGVVTGGVAATTGGVLFVAGETSAATTQLFGNTLAGGTAVVGTTASTVGGVGLGIYELTKAVVVPAGYELGGGMVLGYSATSQLAAHSILAVSDAAYLVLSLEGPRWVVYAVSGNLNSGEELVPGTMLNLEAMQESGEEFRYLPVSNDEVKRVIENNSNDLPHITEPH